MVGVSIGGPYPTCPKCSKGNLVPTSIGDGMITWTCTLCGYEVY